MLTIKQLVGASQSHRSKLMGNASNVVVSFGTVKEGQDARGYYSAVPGTALSRGKMGETKVKKNFEIRRYYAKPPGNDKKKIFIPVKLRKGPYVGPQTAPPFTVDTKAWVFCTCEYFLFHCEVADAEKDNSSINALPRNFMSTKNGKPVRFSENNGRAPVITNPGHVAHLCKHLIAAIKKGALLKK